MTRGLAEPPLASDGEQPTLLRRCGCSPRLKHSVRLLQSRSHLSRRLLRSQGRKKESPMRFYTIRLIATLALAVLVAPLAANAQPPGKVFRVGVLLPASLFSPAF